MKNSAIILLSVATLMLAMSECDCVKEMVCDVKSMM